MRQNAGYKLDYIAGVLLREGRRHWEDRLTMQSELQMVMAIAQYRAVCEAAEALRLDTADSFGDRIRGAEE
jgi:hypothetical protein